MILQALTHLSQIPRRGPSVHIPHVMQRPCSLSLGVSLDGGGSYAVGHFSSWEIKTYQGYEQAMGRARVRTHPICA